MLSHVFNLGSLKPQFANASGSRADATINNFPALRGMSLSLLKLAPKGVREPHWHPNANELTYCLEGQGRMTIFSPGSIHDTLTIEPGTLTFVPMSSIHHIENIGNSSLQLLVCFNHEAPEDINLSSSISVMPAHVLGSTFKQNPVVFSQLPHSTTPVFITNQSQPTQSQDFMQTNRFKMKLEETHPQVKNLGGWVKMSNQFLFPALDQLALYSLLLEVKGIREPHWHPNAHELNYLIAGSARITLLTPEGQVDTFDMKAGDMSFLPQGYFHHIENTGSEPARFAVFFSDSKPSDIGLTGVLGAFSNEILTSLFKMPQDYFDQLPKYQEDLFVVSGGG